MQKHENGSLVMEGSQQNGTTRTLRNTRTNCEELIEDDEVMQKHESGSLVMEGSQQNGTTRTLRNTRKNCKESSLNGNSPPSTYSTRSSTRSSPIPAKDFIDEAACMILSQIDEGAYERAVVADTEKILRQNLLPKSFLWYKPRAELLRAVPRDIEDMPGILNAGRGYSCFEASDINAGPFGFGMFDMGGVRKEEAKVTSNDTNTTTRPRVIEGEPTWSPSKSKNNENTNSSYDNEDGNPLSSFVEYQAAARRSEDPGIIQLAVALPPPPSMESALLSCQSHNILPRDPWLRHQPEQVAKAKAIIEGERCELSTSMPLHWEKLDKMSFFNPPAFPSDDSLNEDDDMTEAEYLCLDSVGFSTPDKDLLYKAFKKRGKRKEAAIKLARSCTRKWRLSIKVGGVSSRASLLSSAQTETRKPLSLFANLPTHVQNGKAVSIEIAQKLDEENGLRSSLGSYDCRASAQNVSMSYQAMEGIKKKDNRIKRIINVDRTRLIWSKFSQANNNKIMFSSILTGEKLDAKSCKRPRGVSVLIRLNGKILSIDCSNIEKTKSPHERKKETPDKNKISPDKKVLTEKHINDAIKSAMSSTEKGTLVVKKHDPNENKYTYCTLHPEKYLLDMVKKVKPKKVKKGSAPNKDTGSEVVPMNFGGTSLLMYKPPTFRCFPLEDGFLRVLCDVNGSLRASSTHEMLRLAAENLLANEPLCSVCWSGGEVCRVLKCKDCSLLVHENCCLDKGKYENALGENGEFIWQCSLCRDAWQFSSTSDSSDETEKQLLPSRKSRRTSRLPNRFTKDMETNDEILRHKNQSKARPNPKCTLCPHSGGAMSKLIQDNTTSWTHEICRVWCSQRNESFTNSAVTPYKSSYESFQSSVCCICGTDCSKNINEKKTNNMNADHGVSGLIRCAANGCNVMFHPMCATLISKLRTPEFAATADDKQKNAESEKMKRDKKLCQEYTLDLLEVSRKVGETRSQPGIEKKCIVPVGFCGIHNPKRDASFYGCPPAAESIKDFITLPYQS